MNGLEFLLSPKPCPKIATGQPLRGRRSRWEEEVEVEPIRALGDRAGVRSGRGNHLRRRLVVRRVEGAEGDGADAAGVKGEERRPGRRHLECRRGCRLPREENRADARQWEHRAHAAGADPEVRGRRGRGLDLVPDLLELARDALRRESGRDRHVGKAQPVGKAPHQLGHVLVQVAPERRRLDRVTGSVAHAGRDDEEVGRALPQQLIRLHVERVGCRLPRDLVDPGDRKVGDPDQEDRWSSRRCSGRSRP